MQVMQYHDVDVFQRNKLDVYFPTLPEKGLGQGCSVAMDKHWDGNSVTSTAAGILLCLQSCRCTCSWQLRWSKSVLTNC